MQATRLVTSSEDDSSPVIMVWDLRNARAPEKVCGFVVVPELHSPRSDLDFDWTREGRTVPIVVQAGCGLITLVR